MFPLDPRIASATRQPLDCAASFNRLQFCPSERFYFAALLKCSLAVLRPQGTLICEYILIMQISLVLRLLKRLYLGCFRGDLDKTLQRLLQEWCKFKSVVFYLIDHALRQCFNPHWCQIGKTLFWVQLADRIEDSTFSSLKLGPFYFEVRDPRYGEVTRLGGVTRLTI